MEQITLEEFGKSPKPKDVYKNVKLGYWCSRQRCAYRKNELTPNRVKLLQELQLIS